MRTPHLLTLTTDFGEESPYVAAMKGVILSRAPDVRLLDLTHQIPAQDVRAAALFLEDCLPYFPEGTVHLIVVDPGVGTERALLHVQVGGQHLVVPDNGCWVRAAQRMGGSLVVRRLTEARFWRPTVSATFHGRDILGPVAAYLSAGGDPQPLGPETTQWVDLTWRSPFRTGNQLWGEVIQIDHFGNLITNVELPTDRSKLAHLRVQLSDATIVGWTRTYGAAPSGDLIALTSSSGRLEIAVARGNAAQRLGVTLGTLVTVYLPSDAP